MPTKKKHADGKQSQGIRSIDTIIGPDMRRAAELVEFLADKNQNILIVGPTGIGKELLAKVYAERKGKKLLAVNCAEFTPDMMASELFGHAKGAFTGAHSDRDGIIRAAAKTGDAVLLLDEFQELEKHLQAKLLRVLETREYRPVGADKIYKIDNDIFLLGAASSKKGIREDILYRFDGHVTLKPISKGVFPYQKASIAKMRERGESKDFIESVKRSHKATPYESSLAEVISHCLTTSAKETTRVQYITEGALAFLYFYEWPGNFRELQKNLFLSVLQAEYAAMPGPGPLTIQDRHLPSWGDDEEITHRDIPYYSERQIPISHKDIIRECAALHERVIFEGYFDENGDFMENRQTRKGEKAAFAKRRMEEKNQAQKDDTLQPFRDCESHEDAKWLGVFLWHQSRPRRDGETLVQYRDRLDYSGKSTYDNHIKKIRKWTKNRPQLP